MVFMRKILKQAIGLTEINIGWIEIENNRIKRFESIQPAILQFLKQVKKQRGTFSPRISPKQMKEIEIEKPEIVKCIDFAIFVREGSRGFARHLNAQLIETFGVRFL